jgi:hypothetical protein
MISFSAINGSFLYLTLTLSKACLPVCRERASILLYRDGVQKL